MWAGQDLIEGDLLSRVGGHASHVGYQAGLHRPRHFVVGLFSVTATNKGLPFQRVRIFLRLWCKAQTVEAFS